MSQKKNKALQKWEDKFKAKGYLLRYEKGNFKSGICLVKGQSVVLVNQMLAADSLVAYLKELWQNLPQNEGETIEEELDEKIEDPTQEEIEGSIEKENEG
ncbi:hypothetical protein [Hugenholtzia roseola]|uniref:hypothetical protein n=1 Tax=Hugenholtzia roseola TaxID=1002 RepID=UPI0012B50BD7|nr:hypothetical protein [Hugenholtzia roseola]